MYKDPQAQPNSIFVEIPSPPEDEAKYREMNGRGEAQLESHASSFDEGSEAQLSLGSKGDVDAHGSSEDLLIDYDDLPVEIGEKANCLLYLSLFGFIYKCLPCQLV